MSAVVKFSGRVVGVLAVLAAVALAAVLVVIPRFVGGAALNVLSGSMTPTIPVGSVVLVVPTDPMTIERGDVITFQTAPGVAEFVTHRVVRLDPSTQTLVTKGDANPSEDAQPVPFGAVRGTVRLHLPYLGTAADFVRRPMGLVAIFGLPALWFLAGRLRSIRAELRRGRSQQHLAAGPDMGAEQPLGARG